MLDMNKFTSIIDEDLDCFNVEEAVAMMDELHHKWIFPESVEERVPTTIEVYKSLRKRLIEGYEYLVEHNESYYVTSTGGYRIESRYTETDGYWSNIMYCPVESIR